MSLFALRPRSLFLTAFTLALAACGGGGDDDAAAGGGAGSGKLTLSASSPAVHDGDIDVATAQTKENVASPADAAIGVPYCAVRMERATHGSNANLYYVAVYFRQLDARVLNASVFSPTATWSAGQFDPSGEITGVSVNVATRTVTFTNKTVSDAGNPANVTTINGSFSFPASTVAACGV